MASENQTQSANQNPQSTNPQPAKTTPSNSQTVTHDNNQATNNPKTNGNSSIPKTFLKIIFGVFIGVTLLLSGFYFGMQRNKQVVPTPTPIVLKKESSSPTEVMEKTASPSAGTAKLVKAGLTDSTSAFKRYSIEIPTGWIDTHDAQPGIDKLSISKGDYLLTIYQAAFGGGGCTYIGDPQSDMAQSFVNYAQVDGPNAQYRRSWNVDPGATTISYSICQKESDNSYGAITDFGRIDATSPISADKNTMSEIDSMVSSIKPQ